MASLVSDKAIPRADPPKGPYLIHPFLVCVLFRALGSTLVEALPVQAGQVAKVWPADGCDATLSPLVPGGGISPGRDFPVAWPPDCWFVGISLVGLRNLAPDLLPLGRVEFFDL